MESTCLALDGVYLALGVVGISSDL